MSRSVNHGIVKTSNPTSGDDVNDGIKVNTLWTNPSTNEHFILDDDSAAVADWTPIADTTHQLGDGSDHANVALNDSHRTSVVMPHDLNVVSKAATYLATASDDVILCDATSGAFDIDLPTAVGITGKVYTIKKTDVSANVVTVDGNTTETIDDLTTQDLTGQYDACKIVSDGANWQII